MLRSGIACALALVLSSGPGYAADVPASGKTAPELAAFDKLMSSFVQQHDVPGATLAVAKDGVIVYSRGFGLADRDKKEVVEPTALFRVASISKPVTAVAILQLVERGKLKLDDRVFDLLQLKAPDDPAFKFDVRWKQVTLRQLLQHTAGWDRNKSFDPMFRSPIIVKELGVTPPAAPDAVIRYMLRQPLDFDPGKDYAYSNFGYCLLGRVIEKATGKDYETYVRNEVLKPLGITSMKLGKTLWKDRAAGEVRYHAGNSTAPAIMGPDLGKPVPQPYGAWNLEAMDAHGGWLASAEDLVRFGAAFNDPTKSKLLKARSVETMFARPAGKPGETADGKPTPAYYGCGWFVRAVDDGKLNTWHTGSLPGTSTLLVRRHDGMTWAVLFNTRNGAKGVILSQAIDPLLHEAANAYLKERK